MEALPSRKASRCGADELLCKILLRVGFAKTLGKPITWRSVQVMPHIPDESAETPQILDSWPDSEVTVQGHTTSTSVSMTEVAHRGSQR